ncbi:LOW QUALITY PROTEIN: homeobox-containing protein 1-like [Haliotis rubra]|uniref:LOW QUALITY PROTEIN: homeobox-containing protein 1-like n=1 Tax=Haliotis rubra TaxID=36100 RepID=UPI001EE57342|nr:LOW QUALITY PROTEIN: homeobox-containing protein 1-like [Haliotis rubra]
MSLPMVSVGAGQALFTVEQIELIRRLRNSGITKEQVIQAFDAFSRIDAELGHLYTVPQCLAPVGTVTLNQSTPCQSAKASSSTEVSRVKRRRDDSYEEEGGFGEEEIVVHSFEERELVSPQNITSIGIDDDLKARLDDFMKMPAPKRLEEIITMVTMAGVRVPIIADKTGLSVSTINRFLQGETVDISSNQRRSIYIWYLKQLQKAGTTTYMPSKPLMSRPQAALVHRKGTGQPVVQIIPNIRTPEMSLDTSMQDSHFTIIHGSEPIPRRERFTFREKHIEILEEAFRANQYPSNEERELIAVKCNDVMKVVSGRRLSERERVTAYIVSNWFNNRRKEIKRLAREEGVAFADVVLPSRLKSRQFVPNSDSPNSHDDLVQVEPDGSDSSQLDYATINKMLYSLKAEEEKVVIKQEPTDEDS